MTYAQGFELATKHKYRFDLNSFKRSSGPDPLLYRKPKIVYVQYEVKFTDGSSVHVIMTDRQRSHVMRTTFATLIKTVGGEGYRLPI
jgi:hypothetical protein